MSVIWLNPLCSNKNNQEIIEEDSQDCRHNYWFWVYLLRELFPLQDQFLDQAIQVYKECAKTASVTKARVSFLNQDSKSDKAEIIITSRWSQRDLERNENRNFHRSHVASYEAASGSFHNIREPSFPMEVQNL